MKVIKDGGRKLFGNDPEMGRIVSEMLRDLELNGKNAIRKHSQRFDDWNPDSFELSAAQIDKAISWLSEQVILDTDYCQGNVRRFARAQ